MLDLLRGHGIALCIHGLIPDRPLEATAEWVYLRFHEPNPGAGKGVPIWKRGSIVRHDTTSPPYIYSNTDA